MNEESSNKDSINRLVDDCDKNTDVTTDEVNKIGQFFIGYGKGFLKSFHQKTLRLYKEYGKVADGKFLGMAITKDNQYLFIFTTSSVIIKWHIKSQKTVETYPFKLNNMNCFISTNMLVTSDNKHLYITMNNILYQLDLEVPKGQDIKIHRLDIDIPNHHFFQSMALSNDDGNLFISATPIWATTPFETVTLWKLDMVNEEIHTQDLPGMKENIRLISIKDNSEFEEENKLLAQGYDGILTVFGLEEKEAIFMNKKSMGYKGYSSFEDSSKMSNCFSADHKYQFIIGLANVENCKKHRLFQIDLKKGKLFNCFDGDFLSKATIIVCSN